MLAVLTALYLALSLWRHWHFGSAGFDLGIFDQAIWHYSRFEVPRGTIRDVPNLLGDHFHPILMLLVPLYWIVPRVETLLVVQVLLIMGSLVPVYLFSLYRKHSQAVSLMLALSYALFWGLTLAINFDFHEIAFAIFALPLAIYLIELKKWRWFWPLIVVLLLTKESMGIVVACVGLYLLVRRYYVQGLIAFTAGVSWFAIVTKFIIPYFAGPGGGFGYWTYSKLGNTPLLAIKNLITKPLAMAKLLITPQVKLDTLVSMFLPVLFLPIISPIFIIGLPLIAERFWSDQSLYWQANFHYNGMIAPILALGVIDTLANFRNWIPNRKLGQAVVLVLTVLILTLNVSNLPKYPLWNLTNPTWWQLSANDKVGYKVLATIPATSSITTQNTVLPHLTQRLYAYLVNPDTSFKYSEYIVIDLQSTISPFDSPASMRSYVETKIAGHGYQLVVDEGGWLIWHNPANAVGEPKA